MRTGSVRSSTLENMSLQGSLKLMAKNTGGQAVVNTVDFVTALNRMSERWDIYYSLGFNPPSSVDGERMNVKVKVRRPKLYARHRKSVVGKPLKQQMADHALSALLYGLGENPLAIGLETGEPTLVDNAVNMVPMRLRIPLSEITLVPYDNEQHGQLSIYVAWHDSEGRFPPVRSIEVPIRIPLGEVEQARQKLYVYEIKMLLKEGEHAVVFGVRDDIGAVESYITGEVTIAGEPEESLSTRSR